MTEFKHFILGRARRVCSESKKVTEARTDLVTDDRFVFFNGLYEG